MTASDALPRTHAMASPLAILELEKVDEQQARAVLNEPGGVEAYTLIHFMERERRAVLQRVATAIHEWATGIYITHKFRRVAGNIFERFKTAADARLATLCPDAINKLNLAVERVQSENPEDLAAAALACRRVLTGLCRRRIPTSSGEGGGTKCRRSRIQESLVGVRKGTGGRKLEEQFLDEQEIEGLCKGLDQVYDQDAKGVHAGVSRNEAEMMVLRTYVLLTQLAQLVPPPQ